MRRRLAAAVVTALALLAGAPGSVGAEDPPGELDPSLDNGDRVSGDPLSGPQVLPSLTCDGSQAESGSRVERRLPDGPRRPDGSLAFVSGVCVYLPPGYDSSGLRYPVIYVTHGGSGYHSDAWVPAGNVRSILDAAVANDADDAAIVVTPDASEPAAWYDRIDGALRNESYVNDHLVPFIDHHYRTIADRSGRAVLGVSNGGYGALHLAAKRPDLYSAAGSMSGNVAYRGTENGGFGDPLLDHPFGDGQRPVSLAPNLDDVDLILDLGTQCIDDAIVDACAAFAFDQLFLIDNTHLVDALQRRPDRGALDIGWPEQGGHAVRWWDLWLAERHLPFVLDRLDDPTRSPDAPPGPPEAFAYRSVWPSFDVWGYDVTVDRQADWEWLDLTDVAADGLTIAGSGVATITTGPRYQAGAPYDVTGSTATTAVADQQGRLTLEVDLGEPPALNLPFLGEVPASTPVRVTIAPAPGTAASAAALPVSADPPGGVELGEPSPAAASTGSGATGTLPATGGRDALPMALVLTLLGVGLRCAAGIASSAASQRATPAAQAVVGRG